MTDALANLETLLPEIGPAVQRRRFGEGLGRTVEALRDAPRHVDRLSALLELAQITGFQDEQGGADIILDLRGAANEAADAMISAADADALRAVVDRYNDLIKQMGPAEGYLRRHWKEIVDRDFRPLTSVGRLLAGFETTAAVGQRFIACGEAAMGSLANGQSAQSLRDLVRRLVAERAELQAEQRSLTRNTEIDAFLDALRRGEASLRHVTPAVWAWLDANGALNGFSVRSSA